MREMKDSGIEWIGKIPKEWEIAKLKNVCTRIIVGLATSVTQYYQDDGIPMFRNLNIKETGLDTEDVLFLNPEWAEKQEGKKIHTDDILTVHTGYIGISCLVPKDYDDCLTFTTLISTVDNKYAIPKYINYWINISRFFSLIYKSVDTGAQINLNIAEFVNLETVVPPLLVQQSVVNYLDEKCTKIDAIIEKQQEIIERLKEYKLSIISEAVTKGLNPDAEMKDSGVEWIGKIPTHWSLVKAKYYVDITNGSDPKEEGDIPVYGSGEKSFKTCGEYKEGPCVLIGRKGATLNIPHYIVGKYWNVDTAFDVKTKKGMLLKYYFYLAHCFDYNKFISQTTLPGMTQTNYNNMLIPVPSIDEQEFIVRYVDEKNKKIDCVLENCLKLLTNNVNYKRSLIYEVVTGKREV